MSGVSEVLQTILTILTGIIIATVSSWITVQLSLRRFRSERWWERQATAYERVIAALHDSKAFSENHMDAEYECRELSNEIKEELRARSKSAHEEILKAIDIGAFLLSDEALKRLKMYQKEIKDASTEQSWIEFLEADWSATDKCIKDIINIAKHDLKVKQFTTNSTISD